MALASDLLDPDLRARVPHVSAAIIRSGTSRLLILRQEEIPTGRARAALILDLLATSTANDGVGGAHYQSNKVAVIAPGQGDYAVEFQFYQVIPQTKKLFARMECSNAASASGLAAVLFGLVPTRVDTAIPCINHATGQSVEVVPPAESFWDGGWEVRFTRLHHLWHRMAQKSQPFALEVEGVAVTGDLVQHGNVFVFVRLPPQAATPGLVAALNARGQDYGQSIGHPETLPKVIFYSARPPEAGIAAYDVTCFSEGQQHHSLPGSAAMAFGAFLTAKGAVPLPPDLPHATTRFAFFHPSGSFAAKVHLVRGPSHWEITATSFVTPVRLLMLGALIPPRPAHHS